MLQPAKILLAMALALTGQAWAQVSIDYTWQVTHDKKLTALVTGSEAARAALETRFAAEKATESAIWTTAAGSEAYSWLRAYTQFLRTLRSLGRVKDAIQLTKIPAWTLIPQMNLLKPGGYRDPETGESLVLEQEVASLSVVPPAYQAGWGVSNFGDDELTGATAIRGGRSLVRFSYPHTLSDVTLTFSPSPFLSDYAYSEGQAIEDMKAHFFEALMDASARIAGFGGTFNPQMLGSGALLVQGRLSPAQLKLQATLYEQQALDTIGKIQRIYVDHGVGFTTVSNMYKRERAYWEGFGERMNVLGTARAMFAMNLMNEVHQAIGRLEAYGRRALIAETDEQVAHLGQKKVLKDGVWVWTGFLEESTNFWDMVDKVAGIPNQARAVKLQALGLSARYSRWQFDEAEGLRNVLMGSERMRIALEGIQSEERQRREINALNKQEFDWELLNWFERKRLSISENLNATGWGGLRAAGGAP